MIVPGAPLEISLSELLDKVPEENIARKYISNYRFTGKPFRSSLRPDNRANSCFVFKDEATGNLMYKDFADPSLPTKISMIEYVSIMYKEGINEAINRIARDFNIKSTEAAVYDSYDYSYETSEFKETKNSELIIKVKKRDWTKSDIEYWNQYSIPITMLERNDIKSISNMWLYKNNKQIFTVEFSDKTPVFSYDYYWSNNIFRRKIYRPTSVNYKWMSNTDYTVVQNYPNIPKEGELLFIQSSYKDAMVMELLGYNSIAPNAEGTWLPLEYWEKIKKRWKKIVIFGNNDWEKKDNPGLSYAKRHSMRYQVPFIIIPDGETSDISDYVKKYDLDKAGDLVKDLIKDL